MFEIDPLYSVRQVREIDARAIQRAGDDGYALMQKAAAFAWSCVVECHPQLSAMTVLAGPGNNGGDALVLARIAASQGVGVQVHLLGHEPEKLRGAAARAYADFAAAGLKLESAQPASAPVIVDGIFGTGLTRAPRDEAAQWVDWLNAQRRTRGSWVLALDIPSGLNADTGLGAGSHVRADCTTSFVARKWGHDLGAAIDACGELRFDALGVSAIDRAGIEPVAGRLAAVRWPRRSVDSHKGIAGHVLLLGGIARYGGATVLAAHGALRSGCGKATILTESAEIHPALWPEVMRFAARTKNEVIGLSSEADVLCLGPGLGRDEGQLARLKLLRRAPRPQIWDADALWALAQWPDLQPDELVITPHPGEAAALLGWTTQAVQSDRAAALEALVQRWNCVTVLKGARTLVGAPGKIPVVVPQGNPGMAVGGMGDVLAGVIAGLCAQGFAPWEAAVAGAWSLADAADRVASQRGYSLLPHDVLDSLRVGSR